MSLPIRNSKSKRIMEGLVSDIDSTRKKPNFSNPADIVTFRIGTGDDQEEFTVHKEFACYYSPVLNAAFNSEFIEGRTKEYQLDDIQPDAFRLFVQWLYCQEIEVIGHLKDTPFNELDADLDSTGSKIPRWSGGEDHANIQDEPVEGAGGAIEQYSHDTALDDDELRDPAHLEQDMNLVQLWVLADKLIIPRLQNAAMLHLRRMDEDYWTTHWIQYAYQHTAPGSPLRWLAVDLCSYSVPGSWLLSHPEDFPHSMLLDLSANLVIEPMIGNGVYRHVRIPRDFLVNEEEDDVNEDEDEIEDTVPAG